MHELNQTAQLYDSLFIPNEFIIMRVIRNLILQELKEKVTPETVYFWNRQ